MSTIVKLGCLSALGVLGLSLAASIFWSCLPMVIYVGSYVPTGLSWGISKINNRELSISDMYQNRLGAVINHLNQAGIGEHIYCVLCGRMTPDQKQIVRRRAVVDTQLFIDILTWFVKESGHSDFQNTTIPEKCPKPLFVINVNVETNTESGTYYFSSAQEPSATTSVYGLSDKFALAMF
jgi:hypothetical protein